MRAFTPALIAIAVFAGGCSYSGNELWRRSVCDTVGGPDEERDRCLEEATRSEADYERDVDQALELDGTWR